MIFEYAHQDHCFELGSCFSKKNKKRDKQITNRVCTNLAITEHSTCHPGRPCSTEDKDAMSTIKIASFLLPRLFLNLTIFIDIQNVDRSTQKSPVIGALEGQSIISRIRSFLQKVDSHDGSSLKLSRFAQCVFVVL